MDQEKLIEKFNKQAGKYAKKREKQAANHWRRMCSQARGETLEAAIGAGMNFPHYPKSIRLTAVDFSPTMLGEAKKAAKAYGIETDFILSAVEELDFPADSFDTIVSTGTLCTYEEPKLVLNLFNRWCKPDGQILLLEHGLSTLPPLAFLQKGLDSFAVKAIGCHQNRDIEKIVRSSDIQIKHIERAVLGYLYIIQAKPHRT
ncbi:MAG TPA: class I SAM-dependent methyltransferase [Bacillales bacterium]|nr:class I SAM-dependent methyltransferase [Bacillales bacterium]